MFRLLGSLSLFLFFLSAVLLSSFFFLLSLAFLFLSDCWLVGRAVLDGLPL